MMRKIADWLNRATGAFQLAVNREAMVLDLCMAPGAFVDCALRSNPSAKVNALTLPEDQGGYRVLLDDWTESNRLEIQFKDVTMFAAEFGIPSVPDTHPDREALRQEWPYQVEQYDLVICDGQVLRNQPKGVYGPRLEPARIISSQLYLGLKRMREGGTMIILLHRAYTPRVFRLIHMFDQFSDIKLVKSAKNHAYRSSFYLVAMNIQTYHEAFNRMISLCSTVWMRSTFEYDNEGILESVSDWAFPEQSPGKQSEIEEYGARFIDLARPIWKIQATGLFHSRFMKEERRRSTGLDTSRGPSLGSQPAEG